MDTRRESEAKPEPLQSIGIFAKLRFATSGFFDPPVALRYRQGVLFQMLERQCGGRLSNRGRQRLTSQSFRMPTQPMLRS